MERVNYSTGAQWEAIVGYSRAVRVGNVIHVAGTTAVGENGEVIEPDNSYLQTKYILEKIKKSIEHLGGRMEDVVRTRMFVVNIQDWEQIGRAHGEFFRDIRPVATMVEVKGLISPLLLIEIEAEAILLD
ncbi:MAG: RidA family protein [Ignavibacteriae bacterium]|nr:RidA family protein [Ignavibacteriota bacterium]